MMTKRCLLEMEQIGSTSVELEIHSTLVLPMFGQITQQSIRHIVKMLSLLEKKQVSSLFAELPQPVDREGSSSQAATYVPRLTLYSR